MKTKEKYQQITSLKSKARPIPMLCQLFEVSQSGYYSSLQNKPSTPRKTRRENLAKKVISIFHQHKRRYGRPRIRKQLNKEGHKISEKMTASIMREQGLESLKKRAFRPKTTDNKTRETYAPNLLAEHPAPSRPGQVLVSDITYIATKESWLYMAAIMDESSKMIRGYHIAENMETKLVIEALEKAMKRDNKIRPGAILHSDRGSQYTSGAYRKRIEEYGLQQSMSAKGNCYDNASMESFWSTLKTEAFPENGVYESKEAAKQSIFEYIEGYYHTQRMHSSLNYLFPLAAEKAA